MGFRENLKWQRRWSCVTSSGSSSLWCQLCRSYMPSYKFSIFTVCRMRSLDSLLSSFLMDLLISMIFSQMYLFTLDSRWVISALSAVSWDTRSYRHSIKKRWQDEKGQVVLHIATQVKKGRRKRALFFHFNIIIKIIHSVCTHTRIYTDLIKSLKALEKWQKKKFRFCMAACQKNSK